MVKGGRGRLCEKKLLADDGDETEEEEEEVGRWREKAVQSSST